MEREQIDRGKLARTLVLIAVVIAAPFIILNALRFAMATDTPLAVVESGSMRPTLNVGDLLVIRGVDPRGLRVGDIIIFHDPRGTGRLIVHRIVEVEEHGGKLWFRTKGDNNPVMDPWIVDQDAVVGKVVGRIAYVGYVSLILRSNPALTVFVVTFLLLIVVVWPEKDAVLGGK